MLYLGPSWHCRLGQVVCGATSDLAWTLVLFSRAAAARVTYGRRFQRTHKQPGSPGRPQGSEVRSGLSRPVFCGPGGVCASRCPTSLKPPWRNGYYDVILSGGNRLVGIMSCRSMLAARTTSVRVPPLRTDRAGYAHSGRWRRAGLLLRAWGRRVRLVGVVAVVGIVRLSFCNPGSRKTFSVREVGLGTVLRLATLYIPGLLTL